MMEVGIKALELVLPEKQARTPGKAPEALG